MPDIKINNTTLAYNNIYYVSPNGDDTSGAGTKENPYLTFSKAYSTAVNGDAVYLLPGTHSFIDTSESRYAVITLDKEGIDLLGSPGKTIVTTSYDDAFPSASSFIRVKNYSCNVYNLICRSSVDTWSCASDQPYADNSIVSNFFNCVFDIPSVSRVYYLNQRTVNLNNCLFITNTNSVFSNGGTLTFNNCAFSHSSLPNVGTKNSCLASVTFNPNKYEITSTGWENTGTGLNPDNTQANIGVHGGTFAWIPIQINTTVDKSILCKLPIIIQGTAMSSTDIDIKHRLLINSNEKTSFTSFAQSPINVLYTIQYNELNLGENTITIEFQDEEGNIGEASYSVVRVAYETAYVTSEECVKEPSSLNLGVGGIAYIKIENFVSELGYLKEATLNLSLLNGDDAEATINVVPITSDWNTETISEENQPYLDISNRKRMIITNTTGEVLLNIVEVAKNLVSYGLAIYVQDTPIEIDTQSITVDYVYQPTILKQPSVVHGNKVRIEWEPLRLSKPNAFVKMVLKRALQEDFSDAATIWESSDYRVTSVLDDSLAEYTADTRTGQEVAVFYEMEVIQSNLPYSGDKWDFDVLDAAEFTQQDNSIDFIEGTIKLHITYGSTETKGTSDLNDFSIDNNVVTFSPFNTLSKIVLGSIIVSDNTDPSDTVSIQENMVSEGTLGDFTLYSKPLNKRGKRFEVI